MRGFKRIICVFFAFILIFVGISFLELSEPLWFAIGAFLLILGTTLGYIAIMQKAPKYSFWITVVAIGLTYFLIDLSSKNHSKTQSIDVEDVAVNDTIKSNKNKKIVSKNSEKTEPEKIQLNTNRDLLQESANIGDLKRYNMMLQNISLSENVKKCLNNTRKI